MKYMSIKQGNKMKCNNICFNKSFLSEINIWKPKLLKMLSFIGLLWKKADALRTEIEKNFIKF